MFRLTLDEAMLVPALAIASYVRERHGAASSAEIMNEFQISPTTLRRRRPELARLGIVFVENGNRSLYATRELATQTDSRRYGWAEIAPRRGSRTRRCAVLAHLADPLVVEPFDGVAKRRQPVAATIRDLRPVKDSLGLVPSQGDRLGRVLDQPELDPVGDGPVSHGSFRARVLRCLP